MKYNRSNITTGVQRERTASLAGVIVAYRARLSDTAGGDVWVALMGLTRELRAFSFH
jgi:hypothetical protein